MRIFGAIVTGELFIAFCESYGWRRNSVANTKFNVFHVSGEIWNFLNPSKSNFRQLKILMTPCQSSAASSRGGSSDFCPTIRSFWRMCITTSNSMRCAPSTWLFDRQLTTRAFEITHLKFNFDFSKWNLAESMKKIWKNESFKRAAGRATRWQRHSMDPFNWSSLPRVCTFAFVLTTSGRIQVPQGCFVIGLVSYFDNKYSNKCV